MADVIVELGSSGLCRRLPSREKCMDKRIEYSDGEQKCSNASQEALLCLSGKSPLLMIQTPVCFVSQVSCFCAENYIALS